MHNINLNERLIIKDQGPTHKFEISRNPVHNAGFKPSPNISHKNQESPKEEQVLNLNKEEILAKTLGKTSNPNENLMKNPFKKANKTEICDSLIEDLEQNLNRIRQKRHLLLDPRKKPGFLTDEPEKTMDFTQKNRDFIEKNEENPENNSINWTERLFSTKPSLQNIENIIENQRKNLENLQNLYKNKRKGSEINEKQEFFSQNPMEIEKNERNLPDFKKKHQDLSKEFNKFLKPESILAIKVKVPEKNQENYSEIEKNKEESPVFGKNQDFNRKHRQFHQEKALKEENAVYFKKMEKKDFDNWRKEDNFVKKRLRESQEFDLSPGITNLPEKTLFFNENLDKNQENQARNQENQAKNNENQENIRKNKENMQKKAKSERKIKDNAEIRANQTIFSQIFDKIDTNLMKMVSKQEVFNYLSNNSQVLLAFDLEKSLLFNFLDEFETARIGLLNKQEFIDFLEKFPKISSQKAAFQRKNNEKTREIKENPEKNREIKEKTEEITEKIRVNSEILDIMQKEFIELDKFEDFIVKKTDFFKKLSSSPLLFNYREKAFIIIQPINKKMKLGEFLDFLGKSLVNEERIMNNKDFISWSEFLMFFKDEGRIALFLKKAEEIEEKDLRINSENLNLLRDLFDSLKKIVLDFAETGDFVLEAKKDPLIKGVLGEKARDYETIGEFLDRILMEAAEYIEWGDILAFLSEKGRPSEYIEMKEEEPTNDEKPLETFEKSGQKEKLKEKIEKNGKLIERNEKLIEKLEKNEKLIEKNEKIEKNEQFPAPIFSPTRQTKSPDDLPRNYQSEYYQLSVLDKLNNPPADPQLNDNSFSHENPLTTPKNLKNLKKKASLTIPKGPSFLIKEKGTTIRQRKVMAIIEEAEKPEKEALEFRFKAKEVPESIKLPKYDNMILNEAEKKLRRGKNQITEAKPFAFQSRDEMKQEEKKSYSKEKMQNQGIFQFKAREIPQSCKNLQFEEMEKKAEEERKLRFEGRKEENLKNVKAFQRMQEAEKSKKIKEEEKKSKNNIEDRFNFRPDLEDSKKSVDKLRKDGIIKEFVTDKKQEMPDYLDEDNKRQGTNRGRNKREVIEEKNEENIEKNEENIQKNEENIEKNEENFENNEENIENNEENVENIENNEKNEENNDKNEEHSKGKELKPPKTANPETQSIRSNDLKSKTDGFQHKTTKKQMDMQKRKEKEALEKKTIEEQKKKEFDEKKAKEEAMKKKVQEKFKIDPKNEKPKEKIKKNDQTEKNYEEEKKKLAEKMANKPLMIEDASHKSKHVSKYRNLIGKYNFDEEDKEKNAVDLEKNEENQEKNEEDQEKNEENQEKNEENQEENEGNQEENEGNQERNEENQEKNEVDQEKNEENPEEENEEEREMQKMKKKGHRSDDPVIKPNRNEGKIEQPVKNKTNNMKKGDEIKKAQENNKKIIEIQEKNEQIQEKNEENQEEENEEEIEMQKMKKKGHRADDPVIKPKGNEGKIEQPAKNKTNNMKKEEEIKKAEENNKKVIKNQEKIEEIQEKNEENQEEENEEEIEMQKMKKKSHRADDSVIKPKGNEGKIDKKKEENNKKNETNLETLESRESNYFDDENIREIHGKSHDPVKEIEEKPQENQEENEENQEENEEKPQENQEENESKPQENHEENEEKPQENQEENEEKPQENQEENEEKPQENQEDNEEKPVENQEENEEKPEEKPLEIPKKPAVSKNDNIHEEIDEDIEYVNDFDSEEQSPAKKPAAKITPGATKIPSDVKITPDATKIPLDSKVTPGATKIPSDSKVTPGATKIPSDAKVTPGATKIPSDDKVTPGANKIPSDFPKPSNKSPNIDNKSTNDNKSANTDNNNKSDLLSDIPPNSKLFAALSACINNNKPYEDFEFPANISSLSKDPNNAKYNTFKKVQWLRPEKIFKSPDYFLFDKIEPNDISQGSLGDCYFLATCSAIAEFPNKIKTIFLNKSANSYGVYSVIYYFQGIPTEILIDDQIPCDETGPIFTKPNGKELWVLLLEKAWAKAFKSYTAMEGGLPDLAMEHLLGFPAKGFSPERDPQLFGDKTQISNLMRESDQKNYILCAGSKGQGEKKDKGIVSGHAYTIIQVYDKLGDFILKMRNPWGSFEWQGKYNEDNDIWVKNKAFKEELGMVKADDGVFFMTIDEFLTEFNYVGICFAHDAEWDIIYQGNKEKSAYYFILEVKKEGDFQLAIHQKLTEIAKVEAINDYKYSPVDLELFKMNDKSEKLEDFLSGGDSQKFFGDSAILINDQGYVNLKLGRYLIRAKAYWNENYFKSKTFSGFNLTLRATKGSYTWKPMEKLKARALVKDFFKIYAAKYGNKSNFDPNKAWLSMAKFPKDNVPRAMILYAKNDEPKLEWQLEVTLKDPQNMRQRKEILKGNKELKMKMAPGGENMFIYKTIEKNRGAGYGLDMSYGFS